MEIKKKKFLLGILIAPLFAPIVFTLILVLIGSLSTEEVIRVTGLYQSMDGFFIILIIGAPIAYLITVIFGIPIYKLTQRLGVLNFWSISMGGGLVAIFPLMIIYGLNMLSDGVNSMSVDSFNVLFIFFVCGVVVGAVFWAIEK